MAKSPDRKKQKILKNERTTKYKEVSIRKYTYINKIYQSKPNLNKWQHFEVTHEINHKRPFIKFDGAFTTLLKSIV